MTYRKPRRRTARSVAPVASAMELCREGEHLVIRVRGEMDLDWERAHGSEVRRALDSRPRFVVFDLADAVFVDSTGLGVVAYAIRHASERVILVGAALRIRQLVHASGLGAFLTLVDGWEDIAVRHAAVIEAED